MTVVSLSLTPEATGQLHNVLACFAKFGETVSLDVTHSKLLLTTLNPSKTAYVSCSLDAFSFFSSYVYTPTPATATETRFTCQLLNKALLSAIKPRVQDARGRDTAIDRCDLSIHEDMTSHACRMIVKITCRHGVTKIYRLTYSSANLMHAIFDQDAATNNWQISSRALREYSDYFGPRTEQLSMVTRGGKAIFTSFTEKIMDGKAILKQPLETAIAVHTDDFDFYHAQQDLQIIISVKDFRAMVTHAESLNVQVTTRFSRPGRPLQFSYDTHGIALSFTLMTTGHYSSTGSESTISSTPKSVVASRNRSEPPREKGIPQDDDTAMPLPARSLDSTARPPQALQSTVQPLSQRRPLAALNRGERLTTMQDQQDDEPLFVSNHDPDDRVWDPRDFDAEEAEDELAWDATGDLTQGRQAILRDMASRPGTDSMGADDSMQSQGIAPTQRLSQINRLFD